MTEAEALRIVSNPHLQWKCVEVDSALTMVRNALDKQIAEKVETRLETRDGYYWKCPICDYNIVRFSYCPNCGQKLDWSEV